MFNQVTYNVLIERFKAFANGHYKIERFSHGQIDVTDIDKDQRFPWMHVVPVSIAPSGGSRSFTLDIVFADMPRDKEDKTEYQRESLSDCIQIAEDLLAEIKNGGVIFGEDVTLEEGSAVQPFMEEYTHVLTGVTLSLTMTFPWNWNACDIPADWTTGGSSSGGGGGFVPALVLKVNDVDNINQNILNLTNGTNVTIEDLGDGRVRINSTGGITSVAWGDIVGNIADQLDLAIWFNEKADVSSLAEVAFSGDYADLTNTPTIPPAQVNSDWNATSGVAEILNKPTIPTELRDLTDVDISTPLQNDTLLFNAASNEFLNGQLGAVAYSNDYNDLDNLPTIPAAQVNADWNSTSGLSEILNKPTIPAAQIQSDWTQANTSALDYIKNKPTIPAVIGDMLKSVYDTDADGVVDAAERIEIVVRNSTGATLQKGQIVYLSGATGNRPNAVLSDASTEATSSKTIGFVVANIANNSDGKVAVNGTLHDLDTSAFSAGDTLWLSETAGAWQANTPPAEPAHAVFLGYVARSHPNFGRIVIQVQNGYELNELHGVQITSEADKDALMFDAATGLWKNKQIVAADISNSTDVGKNLLTLTNPNAISFLRVNADNTVTPRTPAQVLTDLNVAATIILGRDMAGASAVNTTTNTILFSALIPANTLQANDFIELFTQISTTVTNGTEMRLRVYLNNANSVTGATQIGTYSNSSGTGGAGFARNFFITAAGASGNLRHWNGALNFTTQFFAANAAAVNTPINTTINQYILLAVQMGGATFTTTFQGTMLKLTR